MKEEANKIVVEWNCALDDTTKQRIIPEKVFALNLKQNYFVNRPQIDWQQKLQQHTISIILIQYEIEKSKEQEETPINKKFLDFLQNYESRKSPWLKLKVMKKTISVEKQECCILEDYKIQIQEAFDLILNGEKSIVMLTQNWHSNIKELFNQILMYNQSQFDQEQNKQIQKKLDDYSVTLVSLEYADKPKQTVQSNSRYLQSFILEIGSNRSYQNEDQYYIPINQENVAGELAVLYKYFIKQKIREFQPDIIVLAYEINENYSINTFSMKKLIAQLQKQSQSKLLIIPILTGNENNPIIRNKYFKLATCSVYGLNLDKHKTRKQNFLSEISCDTYNRFSNIFIPKLRKQQAYINLQKQTLKLKNQQSPATIKHKQTFKSNQLGLIENSDSVYRIRLVEIYTPQKMPIQIDQETNYQVQYWPKNDFASIFVQYQECLFWKIIELSVQNTHMEMQQFQGFKFREFASFCLHQKLLFQFFGFNDNQYQQSIIEYSLDQTQKLRVFTYEPKMIQIINFTVLQQNAYFSIVGGSIKDSTDYIGHGFQVQLLYQENKFIITQYNNQKTQSSRIANFVRSIKEFENPLFLNFGSGKFLFFETETKYQNIPFDPAMQIIQFWSGKSARYIVNNLEVKKNFHQFQEKSYLFKSSQMNYKVTPIKNTNKFQFDILVQERVNENIRFEKDDFTYIKYINRLGKVPITRSILYRIQLENHEATIDSSIFCSIIQDYFLESRVQQKCLYQHCLDDFCDQEIFHYDIQSHQYLLYFTLNQTKVCRPFIFEYQAASKNQYDDFDESILVDSKNEIIWVVRKKYKDDNSEDLILYESDWVNLQDVKNAEEGTTTKIPITERFTIKNIEYESQIIGIELNNQENLLVVTTTTIYKFSLKELLKQKWDNVLKFIPNSWNKVKPEQLDSMHQDEKISIDYNITQPAIVKCLNEETVFFYSYGDAVCINMNSEYEVKFKQFRWNNLTKQMQESIEKVRLSSESNVVMAKICNIEMEGPSTALGIVFQLEDNTIVRMSHNTKSKNQEKFQLDSPILGARVLNNTGHNKSSQLIYTKEKQVII